MNDQKRFVKGVGTIVLIYNSFRDPLFQNLILEYIKTLSSRMEGEFFLITFEQEAYSLSENEMRGTKESLWAESIHWYPLRFHTGRLLMLKKAFDLLQAFTLAVYLRIKYRPKILFTFANVSASLGVVLSSFLRMKLLIYSYEPHSDFLADFGYWKRTSMKYRILRYLEHMAGRKASYILTGTQAMVDHLRKEGVKGEVQYAPTAVDPRRFRFSQQKRIKLRKGLFIDDRTVFVYMGKFGGIYYQDEFNDLFKSIKRNAENAFFLVLTPNSESEVERILADFSRGHEYQVLHAKGTEEVSAYLSCSDVAISVIPPYPSQRFRSPTKVAEYLLCGLPVITMEGVSEDDLQVVKNVVGVSISALSEDEVAIAISQIDYLLEGNRDDLRRRCREVGEVYRSKKRIDDILYEIYLGQ